MSKLTTCRSLAEADKLADIGDEVHGQTILGCDAVVGFASNFLLGVCWIFPSHSFPCYFPKINKSGRTRFALVANIVMSNEYYLYSSCRYLDIMLTGFMFYLYTRIFSLFIINHSHIIHGTPLAILYIELVDGGNFYNCKPAWVLHCQKHRPFIFFSHV